MHLLYFKVVFLFLCRPFFKVYWICFNIACFTFWIFGHKACETVFHKQGSNPCPCIERWSLNHWTPREVPRGPFFFALDLALTHSSLSFVLPQLTRAQIMSWVMSWISPASRFIPQLWHTSLLVKPSNLEPPGLLRVPGLRLHSVMTCSLPHWELPQGLGMRLPR